MKLFRITITSLFLIFYLINRSHSQSLDRSVVNVTGTSVTAGSVMLEYSIGEAVVGLLENPSVVLTQGFIQGEMNVIETGGLNSQVSIKIYPNPVSNVLNIEYDAPTLKLKLIDAIGRQMIVFEQRVAENEHLKRIFDLSGLSSGLYLLLLSDINGNDLESYTIIKQ